MNFSTYQTENTMHNKALFQTINRAHYINETILRKSFNAVFYMMPNFCYDISDTACKSYNETI